MQGVIYYIDKQGNKKELLFSGLKINANRIENI